MREIAAELKALRLYGMAGAWSELTELGGQARVEGALWLIEHLLDAEGTDRVMRSIRYQMTAARFPIHRDLAGFDFGQSCVDRHLIDELADLSFSDNAHNVVLIGGPGTGKTHLATALGVSGITRHERRVRFFSTVDLVNALEQEKSVGKSGRIAQSLRNVDLVILDELGYLPFSQAGGALLFHLLLKLYGAPPTHLAIGVEGGSRKGKADRLTHSSLNDERLSSLVKIQPVRLVSLNRDGHAGHSVAILGAFCPTICRCFPLKPDIRRGDLRPSSPGQPG